MSQTEILLNQQMIMEMHSHALAAFPEECCGLMFGKRVGDVKRVSRLKKTKNAFESSERYHRYTIDPTEFLAAEKEASQQGEEIIGVYHSHPNAPAKPSEFDKRHAWRDLSYVVIEIREKKILETKSWIWKSDERDFVAENLTLG